MRFILLPDCSLFSRFSFDSALLADLIEVVRILFVRLGPDEKSSCDLRGTNNIRAALGVLIELDLELTYNRAGIGRYSGPLIPRKDPITPSSR